MYTFDIPCIFRVVNYHFDFTCRDVLKSKSVLISDFETIHEFKCHRNINVYLNLCKFISNSLIKVKQRGAMNYCSNHWGGGLVLDDPNI